MNETVEKTETGAILYDPTAGNQISEGSFAPGSWAHAEPVAGALRSAGRGETWILGDDIRQFVLRHYRRGGLVARVNGDAYCWLGANRTRSFAEYRLLSRLSAQGLPVPRPIAARYRRRGLVYTADLITIFEPGIRPLSARIRERTDSAFWQRIGAGIARFHKAGVNHADLNAYNVQVDAADEAFILDFDRGRLMPPGSWRERNLDRLHRSLQKVRRLDTAASFSADDWRDLHRGYSVAERSA